MRALYRTLLRLYPPIYRCEYGEEMMDVLSELETKTRTRGALTRASCAAHETGGLLYGALREQLRSFTGSQGNEMLSVIFSPMFLSRRFTMRSAFRFPKATVGLMMVILAAVMFTIEKAKAISASVPHTNPPVGPILSAQFTILPSLLLVLISAVVAGMLGWGILFALRRSGVHHLAEMNTSASQRSGK